MPNLRKITDFAFYISNVMTMHIVFNHATWFYFIVFILNHCSTIIPERLDAFINKYAEHTHDKWAFEKVSIV